MVRPGNILLEVQEAYQPAIVKQVIARIVGVRCQVRRNHFGLRISRNGKITLSTSGFSAMA